MVPGRRLVDPLRDDKDRAEGPLHHAVGNGGLEQPRKEAAMSAADDDDVDRVRCSDGGLCPGRIANIGQHVPLVDTCARRCDRRRLGVVPLLIRAQRIDGAIAEIGGPGSSDRFEHVDCEVLRAYLAEELACDAGGIESRVRIVQCDEI